MDKWWPDFARRIGRADLLEDARFADAKARADHVPALVGILKEVFLERSYADWRAALEGMEGVWAPVQSPDEVIEDAQALDNGFVLPVCDDEGVAYHAGASPAQFDGKPLAGLRASPALGAQGEEILREAGIDPDRIAALRAAGVLV